METVAALENDVAQFFNAMQMISNSLAKGPHSSIPSQAASGSASASQNATSKSLPIPGPETSNTNNANDATNCDDDDDKAAADLAAQLQMDAYRAPYLEMRRQWLVYGEDLMRRLEHWLDRWDLRIADRVTVMGLADRLARYGVSVKDF